MSSKIVSRCNSAFNKLLNVKLFSNKTQQDRIVRSSLPDIQIPNLTLPEFVSQKWSNHPDRTALECAVTGKKYTFEQLRRASTNLGASFGKRLKLQKGDVVAILLPNTPDYAVCILGALRAGLIVTTINPLYTADEIARHLSDTDAKAIITVAPFVSSVKKCPTTIPIIATKINSTDSAQPGVVLFDELIDGREEAGSVPADVHDVALMPSSSGTTGLPKPVELTHRNIVANVCQLNFPEVKELLDSTGAGNYQAISSGALPFFHSAGLIPILFISLHNMCKVVTLPRFQPEVYVDILKNYKPHVHIVVPYLAGFITNHPSVKREYFERAGFIACSAAPLSATDEERLLHKVGQHVNVVQAYGLTETTAIIGVRGGKKSVSAESRGSVGQPFQNTSIKIVDDAGNPLGPNTMGEILVKGPQVMKGYYKKPQQTNDVFDHGWLKTGDVGYYDKLGVMYVTDRLKELIKVKGFQVAPAELEAVLREHPCVLEAAVVGIPHGTDGEVPRAYVVLKQASSTKSEEIEQFVSDKVANYKQLRGGVVFVNSVPKAASGKILRKNIKIDEENRQS